MRIGSLFSGAAGLDRAVEAVFGGEVVWFSEVDKAASKVLAHRFPGVPNLGDVTKVDWADVPAVDVLCGGYPCQPFSAAGKRGGTDDERHLWPHVVEAMSVLRPTIAVFENVSGHLTLGFDEVLRDLTLLGYQLNWCMLRASDVGAPHQRARLFLLAEDIRSGQLCGWSDRRRGVHRCPSVWRIVPGAPEDCHDRQGTAGAPADGADVRRPDLLRVEVERPCAAGCACVGADGCCGVGGDSEDSAIPDSEGHSCGYRLGLSGDGGCIPALGEWQGEVDAGDADTGRAICGADSGSEPSWPRPSSSCGADCGFVSSRGVVGTGGRLVRADSVRGQVPEAWPNGERAHLRTAGALGGDGHAAVAFSGGGAVGFDTGAAFGAEAGAHPGDGSGDHRGERADGLALLPTPTAVQGRNETSGRKPGSKHNSGTTLNDVVFKGEIGSMLPTPRATDGTDGPVTNCPSVQAICDGSAGRSPRLSEMAAGGLFGDEPGVALLPTPNAQDGNGGGRYSGKPGSGHQSTLPGEVRLLPTPRSSDCFGAGQHGDGGMDLRTTISLLPTPTAGDGMAGGVRTVSDGDGGRRAVDWDDTTKSTGEGGASRLRDVPPLIAGSQWGKYEPAIRRWEATVGPAPAPTEPNKNGNPRLSAAFSEWLMGWPAGWVTDPAIGISRNDQLRIVGNGVVPAQAAAALRFLLTVAATA